MPSLASKADCCIVLGTTNSGIIITVKMCSPNQGLNCAVATAYVTAIVSTLNK